MNNDQIQSMLEAAKPLMKWLYDNCHPHCKTIVTSTDIELLEGVATERSYDISAWKKIDLEDY